VADRIHSLLLLKNLIKRARPPGNFRGGQPDSILTWELAALDGEHGEKSKGAFPTPTLTT